MRLKVVRNKHNAVKAIKEEKFDIVILEIRTPSPDKWSKVCVAKKEVADKMAAHFKWVSFPDFKNINCFFVDLNCGAVIEMLEDYFWHDLEIIYDE